MKSTHVGRLEALVLLVQWEATILLVQLEASVQWENSHIRFPTVHADNTQHHTHAHQRIHPAGIKSTN